MVAARPIVALYVHELTHTGVVRNAMAVADSLCKDGHRVKIVTALPGGTVPAGVEHVHLLGASKGQRWAEHLAVISALRRFVRQHRPALAISMGNHSHAVVWAATLGLRGFHRVYRISNDLTRMAAGAPKGGLLKRWARAWFRRVLVQCADALVLVSPSQLEDRAFAAAEARGRAIVIANGVDVATARRRAGEPSPHPWLGGDLPVVLAIGRLAPQKNFETLLKAIQLLDERRAVRLIILGQSRDSARFKLLAEAETLGIAERLLLPGTTENVFAWLAHADVFALPSWWEGSPNVLLEAIAVGTPVVASRTAGNARHIIGDKAGLLVDPGDAEAIAAAIARQIDPATRIVPGDRAMQFDLGTTLAAWRTLVRRMTIASAGRYPVDVPGLQHRHFV